MTNAELRKIGKKWQKKLGLQDWDISFRFARHHEFHVQGALGESFIESSLFSADVKLLDPADARPVHVKFVDPEETLIHELLHIVFFDIQPNGEWGLQHDLFERAIEKAARAYVR